MQRVIIALAALVAALAASVGNARADDSVQSAIQSAGTEQSAGAASSATQVQPSNQNISVRVLSPGDDGAVTQSNNATSTADAANTAATTQSADQAHGCGCLVPLKPETVLSSALQSAGVGGQSADPPSGTSQANDASSTGAAANTAPTTQSASQSGGAGGVQSSQQDASTAQKANAASSATQDHPSNSNVSVRVLSPGDDGAVSQSNTADSSATATNTATPTQSSTQTGGGSGVQSATQDAQTKQLADAASSAKQDHPSNSNVSVRILSKGDGGAVSQSNDAKSSADATNTAPVSQTASQGGSGSAPCGCGSSSPSVQAVGQSSDVWQGAKAASSANQLGASNANDPVRIASDGNDGSVTQSNDASSDATATNTAPVSQTGTQMQSGSSCGCSSGPEVQAVGQESKVGQWSGAASSATQIGASNSDNPVRIASDGGGGSVSQANGVESSATADNTAPVTQVGTQAQSGAGVQALAQESGIWQGAKAASAAYQVPGESRCGCGPSFGNRASPVRIWSDGNDGTLTQSNDAASSATASNTAVPTQRGTQAQSAPACGCGGLGVQALGQKSLVAQLAAALSSAMQVGAKNAAGPADVWSDADGGSTSQENAAGSRAAAPNVGRLLQAGTQVA